MMNGYGMGWFMGIGMALFWGVVILLLVLAVRWVVNRGKTPPGPVPQTPLEILKGRYARGEISQEEFEKMKRELE